MEKKLAGVWRWYKNNALSIIMALLIGGLTAELGVAMYAPKSWFRAADDRVPLAAQTMLGIAGVIIPLVVLSGILAVPRGWGKAGDNS